MTIKEAAILLSEAGVAEPTHDARVIFKEIGGFNDAEVFTGRASSDSAAVKDAVYRRAKREPLQYIIGRADFYRETYRVTPDCLIPRFDTEILVDYAVKNLPEGAQFIDLCTGSGCVAISTLKNTKNTRAIAVDISDAALRIAAENANALGVYDRIQLLCADATAYVPDGKFFAVLSNPPYVSEDSYRALDREIYYEPEAAFVGGADGGDFYRKITPLYKNTIQKDGFIAYEIGYDQATLLCEVAEENGLDCRILHDLSNNPRVAVLTHKA